MDEYKINCIRYSHQLDLIIATGKTPDIVFIEPTMEPSLHVLKIVNLLYKNRQQMTQ